MKISDVSVEPGTKVYKELRVGELHDGTQINIPVAIIDGIESGPTLLITAGTNGNAISAIEAARRISMDINSEKLRGRLVVIPIVNRPAFIARSRSNIFENFPGPTEMIRSFPGNPEGILSERIAFAISSNAISSADCYIDIGTGAAGGCFSPYVVMYPMPTEMIEKTSKLARSFGTKFIMDSSKASSHIGGRPAMNALSKGIPAILSECGEALNLEEVYVNAHIKGVSNVMKYLGMIDGQPEIPSEQIIYTKTLRITANRGGFLHLNVKLGERVTKGQKLAEITDIFYNVVEQITSQVDGYILRKTTTATVSCGDQVVSMVTN